VRRVRGQARAGVRQRVAPPSKASEPTLICRGRRGQLRVKASTVDAWSLDARGRLAEATAFDVPMSRVTACRSYQGGLMWTTTVRRCFRMVNQETLREILQ